MAKLKTTEQLLSEMSPEELVAVLCEAQAREASIVAEREEAENKANGLVNENAELRANLQEMAKLLRIMQEDRDSYQEALHRSWGFKARLALLRGVHRLAGDVDLDQLKK